MQIQYTLIKTIQSKNGLIQEKNQELNDLIKNYKVCELVIGKQHKIHRYENDKYCVMIECKETEIPIISIYQRNAKQLTKQYKLNNYRAHKRAVIQNAIMIILFMFC